MSKRSNDDLIENVNSKRFKTETQPSINLFPIDKFYVTRLVLKKLLDGIQSQIIEVQILNIHKVVLLSSNIINKDILGGFIEPLINLLKNTNDQNVIKMILACLWNLGHDLSYNREIIKTGSLPYIIQALSSDDTVIKSIAAGCLRCLSYKFDENRIEIYKEGGVHVLLDMLDQKVNTRTLIQVCGALWNIFKYKNYCTIINVNNIKNIIDILYNDHITIYAAGLLRCLTYSNNNCRQLIGNLGGIQKLCKLLNVNNIRILEQVCAALGNLTYQCKYNRLLFQKHDLYKLTHLLQYEELKEFIMITIRNISLDESKSVHMYQLGTAKDIIPLLRSNNYNIKLNTIAALWNLALNDQNKLLIYLSGGIHELLYLLNSDEDENIKYYCRGTLNTLGVKV